MDNTKGSNRGPVLSFEYQLRKGCNFCPLGVPKKGESVSESEHLTLFSRSRSNTA
jgi:hypothetical protein